MLQSPSIASIVLIDPNPDALAVAADNLIRNNLSGIARFVPVFLASQDDETLTFWTVGTGAAGSQFSGHAVTAAIQQASLQVHTLTLDTLCARYDLLPDLVKIDVEGAEHQVLLGSQAIALYGETRFFVEMHAQPELSMVDNADRVLRWSDEVGYTAWYLKNQVPLTDSSQIIHRGRCHLLLQPEAWEFPAWLRSVPQSAALEVVTQ